jgi:hypothetical protein
MSDQPVENSDDAANAETPNTDATPQSKSTAPYPGSKDMPQWNVDELVDAPTFTWKNWAAMLGPGLLMGGAAIGGGEWLMGPLVTARYGGALMWLATLSILGQVFYNIEISRYALYSGEPIFSGKFRTMPGPMFWLFIYLVLDFGAIFPYLAASAATPVAAIWLGKMPDSSNPSDIALLKGLGIAIFLLAFIPLIFGGKIYNSLKAVMSFKIIVVLGFLTILGLFYTSPSTWGGIFTGFVKFGNVPVQRSEDLNGNGKLDSNEQDWDSDGHADVEEPRFSYAPDMKDENGKSINAFDLNNDKKPDVLLDLTNADGTKTHVWPDFDEDGKPDLFITVDGHGYSLEGAWELPIADEKPGAAFFVVPAAPSFDAFYDADGDKTPDGDGIDNIFLSIFRGDGIPDVDFTMIAFLGAFAAIAGSGGLSNAPISNYTRDQGWGMGHHVGAIPSMVGGQDLQLSHEGTVFEVTEESLPRWKRWYKHVLRDQLVVWMPACFLGIALPSILSVEFLKRGTIADNWTAAGMTADGVLDKVTEQSGSTLGNAFWFMTLFCGFLVLAPSMASTIDGFVRRWVDVFWTSSDKLRQWDPAKIKYLYFGVLVAYGVFGLIMLMINRPLKLMMIATNIFNFALGFSCWHTIAVNKLLLPKQLRPGWFMTLGLFLAGLFFWTLATLSAWKNLTDAGLI